MADVNVKLVVTGESVENVNFSIAGAPDAVVSEIQGYLGKVNFDALKTISQIQQRLIQMLESLRKTHEPNKDKKTAHVLLVANGIKLVDKDLLL